MLAGLGAALCLGVADFCVQRVTQETGWLKGLAWSQLLGVPLMIAAALVLEGVPEDVGGAWPVLLSFRASRSGSMARSLAISRRWRAASILPG